MDSGQYISPSSSRLICVRKRLSSVEDCLMSKVVALTSRRVTSLSSPRAWINIVQDAFVRLSGLDMFLGLQARSDVSSEGSLDLTTLPFFDRWRLH